MIAIKERNATPVTVRAPRCFSPAVRNTITTRRGSVSAVCCCCGKTSRAVVADDQGEPDLFELPRGWSQAPFPKDFRHDDGSVGSTHHCPTCNGKLRNCDTLQRRAYLATPTDATDRRPIWACGPAARLLTRPAGAWRVPHGVGVPGHIAYVPYRVLGRVSVMAGYAAETTGVAA